MKQKTNRLHFSTRTVALILSVIMLIGSIATGSMLNTFAAYIKDNAAKTDAIADAASEGSAIAESAIPSEDAAADNADEKPDLSGFEENEIVRRMKEDLAAVGADVDLAETGATYYIWKSESGGSSANQYTCLGTSPQTFSATTGKNYYIAVSTSATSISTGTVRLDGANVSGVSTSTTGTQGFDGKQAVYFAMASAATVKVSYSSGSKIKIEKGTASSSCTTNHKMIVTGDPQLTNTTNWQNTWSGAGTRNQMTYNSAIGKYEIKYTNIAASSSSSDYFRFRILDLTEKGDPDTSWETDKGYTQGSGAITDASNILQGTSKTTAGSDNTFQFSLKQKANITIYLDDSKLDTNSAIEVIVNPAVSTVTAGSAKVGSTVTPAAGTITVSNGTNVAYGGTVTLTASAKTDYVFSQWEDNNNLSYANKNAASTTATVTGSTTVNAIFVPKSYMVNKGTGTGFTITTPSSNQSKQWGTSVDVTAKADSNYALDYLYYLNNNTGSEVRIGNNATSSEITNGTMTRTLSSMPKNNITVYAKVHEKESNTVTYGVCTGQSGYGYVNVGLYHDSASTIKYTIDSGSKVLEGDKVNFCARPVAGAKFVGWYDNAAGSGTALNTSQDYTVTSPSGNYYAKFDAFAKPETGKIKLLIRSATNAKQVYWTDDGSSADITNTTDNSMTYGGYTCYLYTRSYTGSTNVIIRDSSSWTYQTVDLAVSSGKTYFINWDGKGKQTGGTVAEASFDEYYPVKYYVTNPDKGDMANTYTDAFAKKSTNTTLYFKASDTTNWKTKITTTGFTSNDTDVETTDTSRTKEMYSSYREHKATVTFVEKKYYKVNFSAGAGGTVTAKAGGKTITSGTPVLEDTSVTITATPNSGNAVSGWTASGSLTGTSTNTSRTFTLGADTTAKVYFKAGKGTANTGTYFGYGYSNDPYNWTFTSTYVRDGHVFAYIDTIGTNKTFYIGAYSENPNTTEKKYNKMYYFDNTSTVWCSTEFSSYVTNLGRDDDKDYYGKKCSEGKFTVSSAVKALIIDLGPDDGNGKAQTHLKDDNHNFVENNYRIIPVFNTDVNKVSVYAKDASYRNNSTFDYLPGIADTTITAVSGVVTGVTSHSEFNTAVATKGQNITVTTKIGDSYKNNYYVKGFSVNGVTPELYEWRSDGTYTMTYKIPADFDDNYLEITPIYYRKNLSTVQFYIENYDEAFQNTGWGNTLSIYPYYQDTENMNNAFGGYPGQPVINYGGRRFIEIPTSYNNKTIQGVTLSNDYFDIVHRDYCREVDDHLQTYDFDDFYKIYKETSDGKEVNGKTTAADQITFAFKYRTKTNNFSDNSTKQTYSDTGNTQVPAPYDSFAVSAKDSKFKNGWEPLLDYHDRPIDLFGKQLSSANQTKEPLLVVPDDYAITYAGRYATTWTVYRKNGSNYTKIAEIAPSALIVATQARLGTSTYPAVTDKTGFPSTTGHKLADYSDEYQALKAYADTPVQITYESAIRNEDGYVKHWSMTGGSSEVAKRSDGRWFYSYEGEIINADLRIDYTDEYKGEENTAWTTDTFKGNTGEVTGATVHFTNKSGDADGPYALEDYHDTADYDGDIVSNFNHYYKFVATEGSGYIFQGWYMERDGISTAVNADDIKNLAGKSQMTSNATFVARYVKNPAGHITINHTLDDGSTGTATTYIGIEKSADGTNWTWITGNGTDHYERADKVSVNDPDVMSYNSGYTLRVTLKTVVEPDTAFDRFSANNDDHSPNYFSSDVTATGNTSTISFNIPVDDLFQIVDGFPKQQFDTLTYFSHTTKRPELTINHNIDPTSDSAAEGDTYVKVEVLDASSNVQATYGGDYSRTIDNGVVSGLAKGENLTVPSTYFYGGTNARKLRVTLVTDMSGFSQFDKFSILGEDLGNHSTTTGQSVNISDQNSMRTKMAVITFPIADLFNGDTPRVTELPYLSKLIVPEYKYQIKYTYPAYTDKTPVSYTAKDVFAQEDLNTYMSLTSNDLAFKTDDAKKSFACSKAPYEDNFQKILNWSKATFGDRSYNSSTYTLTLQVTISEAEQQTLNVQFNLPYATDKANGNNYEPVVNNGKIIKTDTNVILSNKQTYGRDWFVISGRKNKDVSGDAPVFVKAPLIIHDNSTNKDLYFKYWSVMTEGTANNASREYTRCYDYEFNLAIYQDCIITPEYDEINFAARGMAAPVPNNYGTNPQSSGYDRFDPDVNRDYYKTEDNGLTITFIENSRNQYNNGDSGNAPADRNGAADRLYSDFLLTYNYSDTDVNYSKVVLRDAYNGQKKAGMVIQPVAYMEKTTDGKGRIVQSDEYYANYSTSTKYQGATAEQIKSYIETGNVPSGMLGGNKLQDSRFDVSSLDNKNRIQYFYGMDNAVAKKSTDAADADDILRVGADYNNKYLVYKAFAYIGDVTNGNTLTNVVVSSRPVYFTVYSDATIQPGYYMPNTSGN